MADKKTKKNTTKAPRGSIKSLKGKITTLENDLLIQSKDIHHISDKNIRLLAEFDNYKRRTHEERSNLLKYGGEELAYIREIDMLSMEYSEVINDAAQIGVNTVEYPENN